MLKGTVMIPGSTYRLVKEWIFLFLQNLLAEAIALLLVFRGGARGLRERRVGEPCGRSVSSICRDSKQAGVGCA